MQIIIPGDVLYKGEGSSLSFHLKAISFVGKFLARWFFIATMAGIWGGSMALLLLGLISIFTRLSQAYLPQYLAPVLSALILGPLILVRFSSVAGSGTGEYIEAINRRDGFIPMAVPPLKLIASALTLGTGGSGGLEGPSVLIGGGFSTYFFKLLPGFDSYFSQETKRIATICGAAGALGAIFRSPLGGGIFVVEVLYRSSLHYVELFPAIISSSVGYTVFALLYDFSPLFHSPLYLPAVEGIVWFIIASFFSGLVSLLFKNLYMWVRSILRTSIPLSFRPLVGSLGLSLLILTIGPEVMRTGLTVIQDLIYSPHSVLKLLLLLTGKMLATIFTIASGNSAGLIIPALYLGAVAGNLISALFSSFFSLPHYSVVVAAMTAAMAAVANVPIAAAVMIIEMFGVRLGIPAALGSIIGFEVGRSQEIYRSIKYEGIEGESRRFRKKDREDNKGD